MTNLIATAPEMLAALEAALPYLVNDTEYSESRAIVYDQVYNAIRKAKGEDNA